MSNWPSIVLWLYGMANNHDGAESKEKKNTHLSVVENVWEKFMIIRYMCIQHSVLCQSNNNKYARISFILNDRRIFVQMINFRFIFILLFADNFHTLELHCFILFAYFRWKKMRLLHVWLCFFFGSKRYSISRWKAENSSKLCQTMSTWLKNNDNKYNWGIQRG